jgi:hypothetical protein
MEKNVVSLASGAPAAARFDAGTMRPASPYSDELRQLAAAGLRLTHLLRGEGEARSPTAGSRRDRSSRRRRCRGSR